MTTADADVTLFEIERALFGRPLLRDERMGEIEEVLTEFGLTGDEPSLIDLICDLIQYRSVVWGDRSYYLTEKALSVGPASNGGTRNDA